MVRGILVGCCLAIGLAAACSTTEDSIRATGGGAGAGPGGAAGHSTGGASGHGAVTGEGGGGLDAGQGGADASAGGGSSTGGADAGPVDSGHPSDAGEAESEAAVALKGSRMGFATYIDPQQGGARLDEIQALGVGWVGIAWEWAWLEGTQGQIQWTDYDAILRIGVSMDHRS